MNRIGVQQRIRSLFQYFPDPRSEFEQYCYHLKIIGHTAGLIAAKPQGETTLRA